MRTPFGVLFGFAALFSALLLWPVLMNGGAFLFPDTTTYIRGADTAYYRLTGEISPWSDELLNGAQQVRGAIRPAAGAIPTVDARLVGPDRPVLAGRSIYYGALLYTSERLGGFWLMIALQAVLTGLAAMMAARHLAGPVSWRALTPLMLVPTATAAGFYVGFMLPDIFAPLALIAMAACVAFWPTMGWRERLFWLILLLAACMFHSANIIVAALLTEGMLVFIPVIRERGHLWPIVAVLATGLASEAAFHLAVERFTGHAPIRPPFLAARLIADGPGKSYLQRHCPARSDLLLCRYRDRLDGNSDVLLWSKTSGIFMGLPPAEQRGVAEEEGKFLRGVLLERPGDVALTSLGSFVDQLRRFRVDDISVSHVPESKLPPDVAADHRQTAAWHGGLPVHWLDITMLAALAVTLPAIPLLLRGREKRVGWFVAIVIAGIVVNALVCGAVSTPHDRYQTRMLWLVPLIGLSLAAPQWQRLAARAPVAKRDNRDTCSTLSTRR